jgi:hypothetical protein
LERKEYFRVVERDLDLGKFAIIQGRVDGFWFLELIWNLPA